jgi:ophiobolin F synthase
VFGVPQTINSANYLFALSLKELQKLSSSDAHEIFTTELCNLHLGQSMDLHWTFHVRCPSESEYIAMVDNKTGGLFRLLGLLMQAESSVTTVLDLRYFTTIVGRYFQIRDDYLNLCSPDYTAQKGFCEDLDEGKFSLPLIHMLNHTDRKDQAWSILQERRCTGSMRFETKQMVLEIMDECGSLKYTREVLRKSEQIVDKEIERLEQIMGSPNFVMRLLVEKLRLVD